VSDILSAEEVEKADWDCVDDVAAMIVSHEALRDLAEDYRSRGMQVVGERDGMLAELQRVDEALVARATEVAHQAALIAVISPYVQHRPFCVKSGDRCTCGLITALTDVNKTLETLRAE
jgi:hypothetical protein